jgi:hypothetical protein
MALQECLCLVYTIAAKYLQTTKQKVHMGRRKPGSVAGWATLEHKIKKYKLKNK